MTILAEPSAPAPAPARPGGVWRRLWGVPLWAHLVAATAVLLLLVPVVGTSSSFLADEGAAVIQARSLAAGDGWIVPHPAASLDPADAYYPLVNAEHGEKGFAPLAKHPAYALLLAVADRAGGVATMVLLSVAGTVLAAALAAALARRLDPALVRPTVWAVALGSPLLFDSFLVLAHTLAAALAAGSVLLAVKAVTERRPWLAAGVAPCVAAGVLLRNEFLLFAAALGVATLLVALVRNGRGAAVAVAGSALVAAAVTHAVEAVWVARIVGRSTGGAAASIPGGTEGYVQGRIDGFLLTWLGPGYGVRPAFGLCLVLAGAAMAVAVRAARTTPASRLRVLAPAWLAAASALVALALSPTNIVPGLLLAFPLATAGLVALRRSLFTGGPAFLAAVTAALFALAVLATQYPSGGTGEWGGRYFALAMPVAIPVLLFGLYRAFQPVRPTVRRGLTVALVVTSAALSVMGVAGLRANHAEKVRLVASIEQATAVAGPGAPVVTTWSAAPRFAWSTFDRTPWLRLDRSEILGLRDRLHAQGIDRFVFVTSDLDVDRPALAGLDSVWVDGRRGRTVMVVQLPGSAR